MSDKVSIMESLKNILKKDGNQKQDGKLDINRVIFAFSIAMLLIFLGKTNQTSNDYEKEMQEIAKNETSNYDIFSASNYSYKNYEEERIKNFVMAYDGVEDAKVLLSVKSGKEKILAYETDENSDLSESQSETSDIDKSESRKKEVIRDSDDSPYIIMENEPTFKGIVILVKGNVSSNTINEIRESMKAYLNLGLSKIKVYKMTL